MGLGTDDRLAIQDLCARACHALDFGDPDGYAALFTADGVFQRQAAERAGGQLAFRHQGQDQLRAFAPGVINRQRELARHWTANLVISPAPDGATACSYTMLVINDPGTGGRSIALSGRYHDVFTPTPDGWRFASRTVIDDL